MAQLDGDDDEPDFRSGNSFGILLDKKQVKRQKSSERREEQKRRKVAEPGEFLRKAIGKVQKKPGKVLFQDPLFDFYLAIDFEATCVGSDPHYPHEIIEFPIIAIDARTLDVVAQFHSYVRPTINPTLTDFCKRLTGIKQSWVDSSPLLDEVLSSIHEWLQEEGFLDEGVSFIPVTDGPWDFQNFFWKHSVVGQAKVSRCYEYWREWVDLRIFFRTQFSHSGNIRSMLRNLGMNFVGNPHSGIDDATNIARILVRLLSRGKQPTTISCIDEGEWRSHWDSTPASTEAPPPLTPPPPSGMRRVAEPPSRAPDTRPSPPSYQETYGSSRGRGIRAAAAAPSAGRGRGRGAPVAQQQQHRRRQGRAGTARHAPPAGTEVIDVDANEDSAAGDAEVVVVEEEEGVVYGGVVLEGAGAEAEAEGAEPWDGFFYDTQGDSERAGEGGDLDYLGNLQRLQELQDGEIVIEEEAGR